MERPDQIADAFVAIATANHYMVGFVERATYDELAAAEQILIARDNAENNANEVLNLALDLIAAAMGRALSEG
jgi:hypothetical protein